MNTKRFLSWLLVLAMCLMLTACQAPVTNDQPTAETTTTTEATDPTTTTTAPADPDGDTPPEDDEPSQSAAASPLLYRVTDDDGHTIWLFGSIHVGRDSYYPLPDYVLDAFESADGLAVELDILAFEKDMQQQMNALSHLVYRDGTSITDHIPAEDYEAAVAVLKAYNSYMPMLDMYCPAFWSSMIDSLMVEDLGGDVNLGIDRHLINLAYDADKEVVDIESAEFQYQMLGSFDDTIQLMMLQSSVASYDHQEEAKADLEQMMDLWESGDEEAFEAYLNASDDTLTEEEQQALDTFNKAMVTDRNIAMADYAETALLDGENMFVCVGAAHIVGDGAVAQLLAERGYMVECITEG